MKKSIVLGLQTAVASLAALAGSAHAALPTALQTALTDAGVDAAEAVTAGGTAHVALAAVGVVFGIVVSYIRRMRRG